MLRKPERPRKTIAPRLLVATLATTGLTVGCQGGSGGLLGSFILGSPAGPAQPVPLPAVQRAGRSQEGFFIQALPDEAPLPRSMVRVAGGGSPGSLNIPLSDSPAVVITNVIPNEGAGFIVEGTNLDRTSLRFFFGTATMQILRQEKNLVEIARPTGSAFSGQITIRDGSTTIYRAASIDARSPYVFGRLLVRFREGAPRATIETALQSSGITYYRYPGLNYVVASHAPNQSFDSVALALRKHTVVEHVSRETIFSSKGAPADPLYEQQWALPLINAPAAWGVSEGSPDVVVAVLDTGVAIDHPDLVENIHKNTLETADNGIDDDRNGRTDDINGWNSYYQNGNVNDDNGHGTAVAGIIAAAKNDIGIAGFAPKTRILPCKVSNTRGLATSASLVDGINYAVRNRAMVMCIGVASPIDDPAVRDAVQFATSFNVTVVAPMGNDGSSLRQYPAAWSNQINLLAVGATNSSDGRPTWSNSGDWISVVAPGDRILTTTSDGAYGTVTGTSYAAAFVAGQAALLKSLKPSWTPAMVKNMITSSAVDRGTPGFDNLFGHGRITMSSAELGSLLGHIQEGMGILGSSNHEAGRNPWELVGDRDTETFWSSSRTSDNVPQWLRLDLGKSTRLNSIAAIPTGHYSYLFPADFTIEVSDDEATWRQVARETDFRIKESTWHRWSFTPLTARYVRFSVTKTRKNQDNGLHYAQIAEVAFNGEENNIVINASSNLYGAYPSRNMMDGDPSSFWVTTARPRSQREFAIVDLGLNRTFKALKLLSPPEIIGGAFPKDIDFYASNDKVNWAWVKGFKGLTSLPATWYTFSVPETSARYIRLDIQATHAVKSKGALFAGNFVNGHVAAVAEVDVE